MTQESVYICLARTVGFRSRRYTRAYDLDLNSYRIRTQNRSFPFHLPSTPEDDCS
jgi:hypothetical protein